MKIWILASIALLSACSSQAVRCDKHLVPINPPQSRLAEAGAVAPKASASEPAAKAETKPSAGRGSP
jgi:hypothetical protein